MRWLVVLIDQRTATMNEKKNKNKQIEEDKRNTNIKKTIEH